MTSLTLHSVSLLLRLLGLLVGSLTVWTLWRKSKTVEKKQDWLTRCIFNIAQKTGTQISEPPND